MAPWIDWLALAVSLGLMTVGLLDRQHGRRLAIVAAILASMSAARLVPDTAQMVRVGLWIVAIALMVYMLATTSRETYRTTRFELSGFLAAVAIIAILQVTSLPHTLQMALLVALLLIVAVVPIVAIARTTKP